ncbi:hypothetical protein [Streptomyces sp. NPDC014734]|uniref:hypothetical protein n=1 Tax=Streptomyces sp. NPDC014734 TaxID=3364886 RepID=UPI0036FE68E0
MTDYPTHDYDDQAVSNRLGQHQHTLDDSLDGVLDIEAGLREILIHSHHDTAVDALGTVLDTEAGLAGILPPTPRPQASGTHRHPRAGNSLPALSPAERMTLREYPDVKAAQHALDRDHDSHVLSLASELARTCIDDLYSDSPRELVLDRAHDRIRDLDRALALVLTRARILAPALARVLDLALGPTLDLVRDLDLDHVRDLGLDLDPTRILDTRARVLAAALARAHNLARDLDLALDLADAFIEIRTNEVCRAIGLALHREHPALDTASVRTLLDDFTHDDLRDTNLWGLDLSGVHWSQSTQWPPVVDIEALKARSDETPPGSGIWIVRSGTATVRDLADLT